MTFASNKLAHNWDCNLYEAQWCLNGTRKHIYQIWRLTKKPISSTPSLGPLSRGENTLPSLPEWSWTPNLPGKRQNCAHGDCQSCTLPKWLFASKILTLVTSWSGPTGPDGGLRALRYNWAKQLPAIIGPHDPLCMIWKHMRMWMHIVQILLSCAVFITEFVFRYFRFIPGTTCWGKSSVMDFGSTINSASCSQPIFFMTAMLPDENCSTSRKQYESNNMSIYEPTGSRLDVRNRSHIMMIES